MNEPIPVLKKRINLDWLTYQESKGDGYIGLLANKEPSPFDSPWKNQIYSFLKADSVYVLLASQKIHSS